MLKATRFKAKANTRLIKTKAVLSGKAKANVKNWGLKAKAEA